MLVVVVVAVVAVVVVEAADVQLVPVYAYSL